MHILKMKQVSNRGSIIGQLLAMLLVLVVVSGCKDECENSSDCDPGEICSDGECKAGSADLDTDTDADTDTDGDTDTDADADGDTDTDADSDSTDDGGENGTVCLTDTDCASGHCGGGFCCASGECCATVSDCDQGTCSTPTCVGSMQCVYSPLYCGAAHDSCTEGGLCNGEGACEPLSPCVGPYVPDGTFGCAEAGVVVENCLTSCDSHGDCNVGYICDNTGQCVVSDDALPDGAQCNVDDDCASAHCGDGFCCLSGECCSTAENCDDSLCDGRSCNTQYQCVYAPHYCGEADLDDGELCAGDNACDGYGNCAVVGLCNGPYAASGLMICDENIVDEMCYDSCANITNCNNGYECVVGECLPGEDGVPNGGACSEPLDCASGYCEGNVCCESGECCATVNDCDNSLCTERFCDGNSHCAYYDIGPCGTADVADGETCSGLSLCDGDGDCSVVENCDDGPYAATGDYVCTSGVAETCYTSCTDSLQCNKGYFCNGSTCELKIENGDGTCAHNYECQSDYCTSSTGICCDSGWCCNDNSQCGEFQCNLASFACEHSCNNGQEDIDERCPENFHCDNGACNEDLLDGEKYCNENSDCSSGYCDIDSGICCASGVCCENDNSCEGFTCNAGFNCETDCSPNAIEDDSLCAAGYHCVGSTCQVDIPNGQGGCLENSDCLSGNCNLNNGVCCSLESGDCCNSPSQCSDDNSCTLDYCSATFHCYSVEKEDFSSCSDGQFCNGPETCFVGECVSGALPCNSDAACLDQKCDETNDECYYEPLPENTVCSDVLFCIGDKEKICNANGICVDPPGAQLQCQGETGDPCTVQYCDEAGNTCVIDNAPDGISCPDGLVCNGENVCENGVCVDGENPCDDQPAGCITVECTEGTEPICGNDVVLESGPCDEGPCLGDDAYCALDGFCVPGENRACNDVNICVPESCSLVNGEANCSTEGQVIMGDIECNATTSLDVSVFASRDYYSYNETNCTGGYPGKEGILKLVLDADATVTVTIKNTLPATDVDILYLDDHCLPETCQNVGASPGPLSLPLTAGKVYFVLESDETILPDTFDVEVVCTP